VDRPSPGSNGVERFPPAEGHATTETEAGTGCLGQGLSIRKSETQNRRATSIVSNRLDQIIYP
jgi:hypothetical protein